MPTPASTITGTFTASRTSWMLTRFWMPRPLPIGAPRGITAAAPASCSFFATTTSSVVYGRTMKPSLTSVRVAASRPSVSGYSVFSSPITSSLTQLLRPASRPRRAVRTASSAV